MRTVEEHLHSLPDGPRGRALSRVQPSRWSNRTNQLSTAIDAAVEWGSSPEGYTYWSNIYSRYSYLRTPSTAHDGRRTVPRIPNPKST